MEPFGKDIDAQEAAGYMACLVANELHWIILCSKELPETSEFAVRVAEQYFAYDTESNDHGFLFHPNLGEIYWFRKNVLTLEKLKAAFRNSDMHVITEHLNAKQDILVPTNQRTNHPYRMMKAFQSAVEDANVKIKNDPEFVNRLLTSGIIRR